MTFQCTVRVYELDQTLPVCPTSRRRRDADDDIVESESKRKNSYILELKKNGISWIFVKREFIHNSKTGGLDFADF